jgi:biotin synthase
MPNLTPARYRTHYEIYPNKACIHETADACQRCLERRMRAIGREIGTGRGDAPSYLERFAQPAEFSRGEECLG